jgi:hypothetical protein
MRPDQIDARRKMREYNAARISGVTTTDKIMNDAHERTPLNTTSAKPNGGAPGNHEYMCFILHQCEEECQKIRHGCWPSQPRTLIYSGKAPKILSTEMFWRGEAAVFFFPVILFLSVHLI